MKHFYLNGEEIKVFDREKEINIIKASKTVGDWYRSGKYIGNANICEAIKFYGLAASIGNSEAMLELYHIYRYGEGCITPNQQIAVAYLIHAAEDDYPQALIELADCYEQEEMGFVKNQDITENAKIIFFKLGVIYEQGRNIPQDYNEAIKWYTKAAELNFDYAQFHLGDMFQNGHGISKNLTDAAMMYHKAAEQGLAKAQFKLGTCYENGEGIAQDYAQATQWYRKAGEQGHEEAKKALERLEKKIKMHK